MQIVDVHRLENVQRTFENESVKLLDIQRDSLVKIKGHIIFVTVIGAPSSSRSRGFLPIRTTPSRRLFNRNVGEAFVEGRCHT
jgi:hypothetical protein